MNIDGWTRVHVKMRKWDWYKDSHMVHLMLHCILKANAEPNEWQGVRLGRGEFVSSLWSLKKETGMPFKILETCLRRMEGKELAYRKEGSNTIINVINYDQYQFKPGSAKHEESRRHAEAFGDACEKARAALAASA